MAGSWSHIVDDEGKFRGTKLLENGGDVKECLEEVYGMVWYLADQLAMVRKNTDEIRRLEIVKDAQTNYQQGLEISPSTTYHRST